MILIISICKEKLHELEFVKPIEEICKKQNVEFIKRHYKHIADGELKKANKVVICGTSLKDFDYCNDLDKFNWIKNFDKPLLGICAGMQIIVKIFGCSLREREEIGEVVIDFEKDFLDLFGKQKVYSIHRLGIGNIRRHFETYAKSNKGIQAVKHKEKEIYGVMFHPEVWNKELIEEFIKI